MAGAALVCFVMGTTALLQQEIFMAFTSNIFGMPDARLSSYQFFGRLHNGLS
jgi:hypothetical protein